MKAIADSSPQTSLQVKTLLLREIDQLKALKQAHRLKDQRDSINKFARQVQELAAVVDIWWLWIDDCLESYQLVPDVEEG